jgi:Tfp pilus assembly PilM family ATPase
MFRPRQEGTLAIDLAPDAVRVLEVSFRRNMPQITSVLEAPLARDDDGKINAENLPERHLAALETLLSGNHLKKRSCVAAVPTNLVVTRSVTIDGTKTQSSEEQIRQTLQNCMSVDVRNLMFDSWPVSQSAPDSRTQEMLVVATQRSIVQRYLDGFTKLKLSCGHLDVAPCALADLIAYLAPGQESSGGMVGTIVLAEGLGYFAVVEKQRVLFWRPFELPDTASVTQQTSLGRIGDEISKCVSHMVGALHLDGMNEIVAFGRGTLDEGFSAYLNNRFCLPVRTPSPFQMLPAGVIDEATIAKLSPEAASSFAAALGLAMQGNIPAGEVIHG